MLFYSLNYNFFTWGSESSSRASENLNLTGAVVKKSFEVLTLKDLHKYSNFPVPCGIEYGYLFIY